MKLKNRDNRLRSRSGKKIWEIDLLYHCPILGTCMPIDVLKNILRENNVNIEKYASNYTIHGLGVGSLKEKNAVSASVQKYLENHYQSFMLNIYKESSEKKINEKWENGIENGDFAGIFWAIISHPNLSETFKKEINGDLHILSHEGLFALNKEKKDNAKLMESIIALEEKKDYYRDRILQLEVELENFKNNNNELAHKLEKEKERSISLLKERDASLKIDYRSEFEKERVKLNHSRSFNQKIIAELKDLKNYTTQIAESLNEKTMECFYLEKTIIDMKKQEEMSSEKINCDQQCENCRYSSIEGQKIVYVGGLNSSVENCKWIVEKNGGKFAHHDGGLENAASRLSQQLLSADYVFCPVDNISHDASNTVKKICKKHKIKHVFLKSSGFSSFVRVLEETLHENSQN